MNYDLNYEMLNAVIEASGMKKGVIAKKMGITRTSLYNKCIGKREFSLSEMHRFVEALGLSLDESVCIFFAREVGTSANS